MVLDLLWFSFSLDRIYNPLFESIQKEKSEYDKKIIGGIIAWALLAFGINYFVVNNSTSVKEAWVSGLLFGIVTYGIYNLTNYVTFNKWSTSVMLYDTAWGSFVCSTLSALMFWNFK
jgi:uncharacterized membrane protein